MQKIHTFTDSLTKIKHTIYEFPNGIKFLHAKNPSSIEYVLTVIVKAGSSFENINNVPHGTAHFLEHIISGNPNKLLKSKFEIDEFESGSRDDPEIFTNASTSKKYIYIHSHGNQEASKRINQRVKSILDYPLENFSKYIEKERKIILAEQSHMNKDEFNKYLQFSKFLYKNNSNGFIHSIIGEKRSIEAISTDDLEKFFRMQFRASNILITLQNGSELLKSEIKEIEEIANLYLENNIEAKMPSTLIPREKREHHFKDNQIEGVSFAILFPQEYKEKLDYKEEVLEYIFRSLIRKISHDYLREKLGLIYSAHISSNFTLSFTERIVGFEVITQPNNFEFVLKALNGLIERKINTFLKSKEGKLWFESIISSYIFPRNVPYKLNYAEQKGLPLVEDKEVFEVDKAINLALKIDINDVREYSKSFFSQAPLFWIESDSNGRGLIKKLKNSKLYNRF